ncbi:ATP-dependent nuclease [Thioalbus denitrificans]|uniref:AAA15 family ATPase/GTPase n=1 Tax=Thioalbus denitrificans TaxID=547122 RepID=A0A369BX14_9GAMM|nr:AAA family ATPase [Thioalbus denitrificans]RCX24957.1 AAA15 family ATPase/GTPase [Thioalbus denitrificans]
MLTHITIRNFKGFDEVSFELGDRVIFIGPNNSGKTSALQALALWDIGLKRWIEKRGTGTVPNKRPGVTVNRRDLITVPVPDANLLWRNLHVRESTKSKGTQNIRIDIIVSGVSGGEEWQCGLEFDYANEESFYCRPLRLSEDKHPERMQVPEQAQDVRVAYLPPMSGLTATETRLDVGAINVRLGEGRTAEVLRNLCHQILEGDNGVERWNTLAERIHHFFGIELEEPRYIAERGEITLAYRERNIRLDVSSSGRGLQQTLLLLAHMMVNRKSVLLMDEPDAHLEILRQRQIYQLLTETASEHGNQIIAASHSEVILNEAADRDMVVAFVGKPHRIDDRGSQVLKSLKEIGYDQYYQAEEMGWVLYLEGSTDLAILRAFSRSLGHPVMDRLERPFAHYVLNQPQKARDHFYGLREAKAELAGIAIYDRLDRDLPADPNLQQHMWKRREIENYLCSRDVLRKWARNTAEAESAGPLFAGQWESVMDETLTELESALETLGKPSPWSADIKVTDDFLDPLFEKFFRKLGLPNLIRKTDYHVLAKHVDPADIDPEVIDVLDAIQRVAGTVIV